MGLATKSEKSSSSTDEGGDGGKMGVAGNDATSNGPCRSLCTSMRSLYRKSLQKSLSSGASSDEKYPFMVCKYVSTVQECDQSVGLTTRMYHRHDASVEKERRSSKAV